MLRVGTDTWINLEDVASAYIEPAMGSDNNPAYVHFVMRGPILHYVRSRWFDTRNEAREWMTDNAEGVTHVRY